MGKMAALDLDTWQELAYAWGLPLEDSAELKGPRKLLRIRAEIFDFESGWDPRTGTQQFRTVLGGLRRVSTAIRNF
jgi:hypothetical protein